MTYSTAVLSRGPIWVFEALERDASKDTVFHDSFVVARTMSTTRTTPIEPGYKIQLPAEWAESLGLKGQVVLTQTIDGILVHASSNATPNVTWDDVFATKLSVRPANASTTPEITEVSGDDLLF